MQLALHEGIGNIILVTQPLGSEDIDPQIQGASFWQPLLCINGKVISRLEHPAPRPFELRGVEHHSGVEILEIKSDLYIKFKPVNRSAGSTPVKERTICTPKCQSGTGSRLDERNRVPFGYARMR